MTIDYTKYFEYRTRQTTQEKFVCLKDEAPKDLKDFMYLLHDKHFNRVLPNDWIYDMTWTAFDELSRDNIENITIEADCYYSDLYKWLKEPFAASFCNEGLENGVENDIWKIIGYGQYLAKEAIYRIVNDFINRGKENDQ